MRSTLRREKIQRELEETKLQLERLRLLCVTQRMAYDRMQTANEGVHKNLTQGLNSHLEAWLLEHRALVDAMAFFDRVAASKSEWTAADVRRLAELRKLAGGT